MEAVMCNVVNKDNKFIQMPCYLYDSHGITIMLHTSLYPKGKKQFTCSEYLTGYRILDGETMQEALDNSIDRLRLQSLTVAERVVERVKEVGQANKPKG